LSLVPLRISQLLVFASLESGLLSEAAIRVGCDAWHVSA